ncbi:MAG: hypothetical protein ACI8QZ_003040 [Chlamydiales bacterium]|jgi:hypothetical protein
MSGGGEPPRPMFHSLLQRLGQFFRRLFAIGGSGYLCDRCKWDYGDACSRPERPNAHTCPDFKRR